VDRAEIVHILVAEFRDRDFGEVTVRLVTCLNVGPCRGLQNNVKRSILSASGDGPAIGENATQKPAGQNVAEPNRGA